MVGNHYRIITILLPGMVLWAAAGAIHGNGKMDMEPVERTISLQMGQQTAVAEENMLFLFAALLEDSRCPKGVSCIWEGNAAVTIRIDYNQTEIETVTLNTHGGDEYPKAARVFGHDVALTRLDPYPKEGILLDPEAYTAILTVTRTKQVMTVQGDPL